MHEPTTLATGKAPASAFSSLFVLMRTDPERFLLGLFLGAATLVFLLMALLSLQWEIFWDLMHFHRVAMLMNEHGRVLYRDFFDVNMFGTIFLHAALCRLVGYGDMAWRAVDLVWLLALAAVTWKILVRFCPWSAWVSCLAFSWLYLVQGESQTLQRDYMAVLPLATAVLLALSPTWQAQRPVLQLLAIGMLVGVAATFKPQMGIALPWLALVRADSDTYFAPGSSWKERSLEAFKRWGLTGAGFGLVLGLGVLALAIHGGIFAFWDTVRNYWPVYTQQMFDGAIRTATPAERQEFFFNALYSFKNLNGRQLLILPALLASVAYWDSSGANPNLRATARLLRTCLVLYYLEVLIVGNFHPYSWIPMVYFMIALCSLIFANLPIAVSSNMKRVLTWGTFGCLVWSLWYLPHSFVNQIHGRPPITPWTHRTAEMVAYLKPRLEPNDKIQALDWLGGTERVQTELQADNGTEFLTDVVFFHATSHPYVKLLQQRFLDQMAASPPRFVIPVDYTRMYTVDPTDDGSFRKQVGALLAARYKVVVQGDGYRILERKHDAEQTTAPEPK
ncbi:MAG: hypothetical protein HS116_23750 [Planctomycetes bacterium]|nr:hypothetical protein [Planctomycetota bacterium]